MIINLIKTDKDYQAALKRLSRLIQLDPPGDSPEADEIELLGLLIGNYEEKAFPSLEELTPEGLGDPVDEIEFQLDRLGLTRRDLIPLLGSVSRVSEILNRKRPLTLAMIRKLHSELGCSLDALVMSSETGKPRARR